MFTLFTSSIRWGLVQPHVLCYGASAEEVLMKRNDSFRTILCLRKRLRYSRTLGTEQKCMSKQFCTQQVRVRTQIFSGVSASVWGTVPDSKNSDSLKVCPFLKGWT